MGHIEGAGRPSLQTVSEYLNYAPSRTANYRLDGVSFGHTGALAHKYTENHRDGIMLDGTGQIANIFKHAIVHHIDPRTALIAIQREISSLGKRATDYQLQTLDNINDAISLLPKNF